jgi:hypothetical protein
MTRMAKSTMPKSKRGISSKGGGTRKMKWVEGPGAIAPDDHLLRLQILHRTTSRVKFNSTIVVSGELAHRNKVLNEAW